MAKVHDGQFSGDNQPGSPNPPNIWKSTRFTMSLVACIGFACNYSLRINLSVAIVAMINHTALALEHEQSSAHVNSSSITVISECGETLLEEATASKEDGEFAWNKAIQGNLLSGLFYGYIVLQLPGGLLSHAIGGQRLLGFTMLIAALATILTPVVAPLGWQFVFALRFIVGLGLSCHFPSAYKVWSTWAPSAERSILIGITFAGCQIGNFVTLGASGLLASAFGWQSIFYVTGSAAALWSLLWLFVIKETPDNHQGMNQDEKLFIKTALAKEGGSKAKGLRDLPWKSVCTSVPFLSIICAHFGSNFSQYLMMTNLPTFMHDVLRFDIKSNALLSALPYVAYTAFISASSFMSDYLRRRQILSTADVRKLMMFIALVGQSAAFIGAAYTPCGLEGLAVFFMTLAMGLAGCGNSGYMVNAADIAPAYSGLLFSISNVTATIPGFIAPMIVSALTPHGTRQEWQIVLWLTTGIELFAAAFYTTFAKGEVQKWAKEDDDGRKQQQRQQQNSQESWTTKI